MDAISVKTLKFRVKDKHIPLLLKQAKEVNMVWNYVNDLSAKHTIKTGKFMSEYEFSSYTSGAGREGMSIPSMTIQSVAREFVAKRKQFKKHKLRWRVSSGAKKSLGWIPIKKYSLKYQNGKIIYQKQHIGIWDSYGLENYEIGTGSFNEDSRGRWYLNVSVKVNKCISSGTGSVGIDLGCKESATTSDGATLTGRQYRKLEPKLAMAQRANKKKQVKAIHAKIKNRRKDEQHKFTSKLVANNAAIFVGDVSSKLIKTKMAKSVLDAGWSQMKIMLEYKCNHAGVVFEVINESYSTQTCSCCGCISDNSPKGRAGLGIREWTCAECGESHDRDINAAKNILAAGHCRLAGGIPLYSGADAK